MSPPPINLNKARKAKQARDRQALAAANRVTFGRSKAQKRLDAAEALRQSQALDGSRREP
jgi:hypothetical protein